MSKQQYICMMDSSNEAKKRVYKKILRSEVDGKYPLFGGPNARFFFSEDKKWIAVDNSNHRCFVEEFDNVKDAIDYLKNGYDQKKVQAQKSVYCDELSNEDGEVYILKERYTKEEAIFLSKEYEDETFPYTADPIIVHMRPATENEIKDNYYEPGWHIELESADSNSKEYWKFIPDMYYKFTYLTGIKV